MAQLRKDKFVLVNFLTPRIEVGINLLIYQIVESFQSKWSDADELAFESDLIDIAELDLRGIIWSGSQFGLGKFYATQELSLHLWYFLNHGVLFLSQ